jgi:hypothetical protein
MVTFTLRPIYSLEEPRVHIQHEAECASEPLGDREKPFTLPEVEPRFPECATVCSLVSTMIALRDPDLKLRAGFVRYPVPPHHV